MSKKPSKMVLVDRGAQQQLVGEFKILIQRAKMAKIIEEGEFKQLMDYIKRWEDVLYPTTSQDSKLPDKSVQT